MASQWEHIKWIPGTRLMVDGFRFQNPACKSYLLTHFHSDHTTGLSKGFNAGLIFCTPVTARLLRKDMGMAPERICELEMDRARLIEGAEVTPIDANHCPGACMFLIKTKAGPGRKAQIILHTGDLRWSSQMALHPALQKQRIDYLFLDTTYAKPAHTHPPQDICIETMAKIMREEVARNPRTLFVCGSYHIGKERAYLGVAKILGWKVWCDANKRRVLKMLDLPDDLMILLCTKPKDARIHVDFLGGLQPERLQQRISPTGSWTHVVAFRPTGWTYRRSGKQDVRQEGNVKIYGIPYSEHSSFPELRDCVASLRPLKLVPTVNATNHAAAEAIISRFADLMDLSEDKSRLDFFMRKRQKLELEDDVPYMKPEGCCDAHHLAEPQYSCTLGIGLDLRLPHQAWPTACKQEDSPRVTGSAELPPTWPAPNNLLEDFPARNGAHALDSRDHCRARNPKEAYQDGAALMSQLAAAQSQSPFGSQKQQSSEHSLREPSLAFPKPASCEIGQQSEAADGHESRFHEVSNQARGPKDEPGDCVGMGTGNGMPGFSRRHQTRQAQDAHPAAADQSSCLHATGVKAEPIVEVTQQAVEAHCTSPATFAKATVQGLCGSEDPSRADSNKSSTEHVDVDAIDVSEQEKILQAIVEDKQRMVIEIARSLTKKRQSSMAAFLKQA